MAQVTPSWAHERRLRAGFIGCGSHAGRNIYPALQYAPVDLQAVCDVEEDRARAYARQFGALRHYTDHRRMLEQEELDCVFVVTGYRREGDDFVVGHADLAVDVLTADVACWVEKPPVGAGDQAAAIREAMNGRQYAVGLKKAFTPANRRLRICIDEMGPLRSLTLRYAQTIPSVEELASPGSFAKLGFLDHLWHPLSLLRMLAGPAASLWYAREPNGAGHVVFTMRSGAVASLHLAPHYDWRSFGERTEATCAEGMAVAENNTRVTVHRPMPDPGGYGRESDFTAGPAAQVWEPEFSLGNLMNKGLFLLGYCSEIQHFCEAVLHDKPVEVGGIDYAEEGIRVYEAFARGPHVEIEL